MENAPRKGQIVILSLIAVVTLLVSAVAVRQYFFSGANEKKPFYFGVTFCGNTTQEASVLVDRVKDYTNLFVLQSGPLMRNTTAVMEIGDYVVSKGLHFAAYFDSMSGQLPSWVSLAEQQWGGMFAGLYYGDEPGGKMLDDVVNFETRDSNAGNTTGGIWLESITKLAGGRVSISKRGENVMYNPDGRISIVKYDLPTVHSDAPVPPVGNVTEYYPNGTLTFQTLGDGFYTAENGSSLISQLRSYKDALADHPLYDWDDAAEEFVGLYQSKLERVKTEWLSNVSFPVFTSDYAFYWFDYSSGYDVVLAQLGWNNTAAKEIGFVRGAANLQNKDWGAIITWTYTKPPYLASGDEIYSQMRFAYESGADYVVVFNYAENMDGPYGILQDEHFDALKRFWSEVVQNPGVSNAARGEVAFVLPKNCGWSMRNPDDLECGVRAATADAQRAFSLLEDALAKHGSRLDIVYDDPDYPLAERYSQLYYWNQTK